MKYKMLAICLAMAAAIPFVTASVATAEENNPMAMYETIMDEFNAVYHTEFHMATKEMAQQDLHISDEEWEEEEAQIRAMDEREYWVYLYSLYETQDADEVEFANDVMSAESVEPASVNALSTQRYYYAYENANRYNCLYVTAYWTSVDGYNHYSTISDWGEEFLAGYPRYVPQIFSYDLVNYNQEMDCLFTCRKWDNAHTYVDGYKVSFRLRANGGDIM